MSFNPHSERGVYAISICGLVATYAVIAALAYRGIGIGDGIHYAGAALDIADGNGLLGTNHWSLRWPLVAPLAWLQSTFGPAHGLMALPNAIYGMSTVVVSYTAARALLGQRTALLFGVLILATVTITIRPLEVTVDGVELSFIVASLWLFLLGLRDPAASRFGVHLLASGIAAGGAWLCRESTAFLSLTIALTALWERKLFWRIALYAGGGFLTVIAAELAFYATVADDPFYRLSIDLGHGGGSSGTSIGAARFNEQNLWSLMFLPLRDVATSPLVMPLIAFTVLLGGIVWRARLALSDAQKRTLKIFVIAAVTSFVLSAYGLSLENPTYYPVVAYTLVLIIAVMLMTLANAGHFRLAVVLGAAYVVVQLAFAVLRTDLGLAPHRWLTAQIAENAQPIYLANGRDAFVLMTFLRLEGVSAETAATLILNNPTDALYRAEFCDGACQETVCTVVAEKVFRPRPFAWRHTRTHVRLLADCSD